MDSPSTGDLRRCGALLTTGWACSFGSPNEWARSTRQLTRRVRSIILFSAPVGGRRIQEVFPEEAGFVRRDRVADRLERVTDRFGHRLIECCLNGKIETVQAIKILHAKQREQPGPDSINTLAAGKVRCRDLLPLNGTRFELGIEDRKSTRLNSSHLG